MNKKIILICRSVAYYSHFDETAFFEWIKKIPSITNICGTGCELHLYLPSKKVPDHDLREIIALFYRYKIDMKQLKIFLNENNKSWFYEKPKGYWHKKVFN